ncbi:putative iron/ascorbate oxidoreductase DDB_G0283291 [Tachypleus tridentatus]|uniref:putative iron/ascorbate oxidoreductase DDB_G0283291 n=1 Tax=Tachypleus tridentatus TaxID=6853 RepID=UPI003FD2329B
MVAKCKVNHFYSNYCFVKQHRHHLSVCTTTYVENMGLGKTVKGLQDYYSLQTLDPDVDYEIKDAIAVTNENSCLPPEKHAPGLKQICLECISAILTLSNRFLKVLAIALIELRVQKDFFLERHTYQEDKNRSFGMFYYPPVGDIKDPNVARLGEHTDFRTITFLFQDDSGGMELKTKSGQWIQATPIKGTVILLLADLMSIWSNGLYPATFHRLVLNYEAERRRERSSFVYFFVPDKNVTVEPLHSTIPTIPLNSSKYIKEKYFTIIK